MSDVVKRNLERVELWQETWNHDYQRMVNELYAEDCEVRNMITGFVVKGRKNFMEVERAIHEHTPGRYMEITKTVASGETVALEADVHFGEYHAKGCVFLTFGEDGFIVSDHSYAADPTGTTNQ